MNTAVTAVTPAVAAGAQGASTMEDIVSIHNNTTTQNPNNTEQHRTAPNTGPPPPRTTDSKPALGLDLELAVNTFLLPVHAEFFPSIREDAVIL